MTRKQWILFAACAVTVLAGIAALILLPIDRPASPKINTPIKYNDHMKTIEGMGKPHHERPVVAIIALNEASEVTDLMIPYGVLKQADVADVAIVAEKKTPISLYPFSKIGQGPELFKVDPQASMDAFDKQYPDGADYVIIPALEPRDNKAVTNWISSQHRKGANIISVCAGALTLAATGLLDNRQGTTHWAYIDELKKAHPTMQIVRDRRYVSDRGVTTATGISASLPTTVALVEAIAGKTKAEQVAQDLGLAYWDERHHSADFQLTWGYKKTFVRNWITFWRKETIGVPVSEGMDEIALALTADAYSRTSLANVLTVGKTSGTIRGKYGLMMHPNTTQTASVKEMLPAPDPNKPGQTIGRVLKQIESRYDRPTAEIVALTLEYPWTKTD